MSDMNSGIVPIMTECMMTRHLYVMRCSIGSRPVWIWEVRIYPRSGLPVLKSDTGCR